MIRSEFKRWSEDIAARLPDTGAWIAARSEATRDIWFREIFQSIQLDDALEANRQIASAGIAAYERETLPTRVAKIAADIAYQRTEAAKAKPHRSYEKRGQPADYSRHFDTCMKSCYGELVDLQHNGDVLPADDRKAFIDQYFELHDNKPDDERESYRCLKCRDTGYVAVYGKLNVVGHCKCELGQKKADQKWRSGRKLGPASTDCRPNFVQAFEEF